MISSLLSMPRASWKWRVVALFFLVTSVQSLQQAWGYLHDNLPLVHGYGWCLLFMGIPTFCGAFLIGVLGRVPRSMLRRPGDLHRTIAQIHADIAQEQRDKSREL